MPIPRTRPGLTAGERSQLVGWLDLQRSVVQWKCEGVSEEDAHRSVLPDSPLMTVAGIVSHLRWTEHCWFQVMFLNHPASSNPQFGDADDEDFRTHGAPLSQLLLDYDRECAASNEVIAAHELGETGRNGKFRSGPASLRWMVLHMVEETARHAGHLDTIRELLDGETGYY
ncbi:DinB family protein [Streptomyces sp. NPDC060209]|uniref:DinB family protein n=1 Tax=Streptomyces sp. NPDC060209 TaxID=3347073 RepID=UPI0036505A5D